MTRVLLDTHTLLWWANGDPRLSARARALITDPAVEVLVSAVSGWEIAIKAAIGNLNLRVTPEEFVRREMASSSMLELPVTMPHALHTFNLPMLHQDPFDRLLVSQAQVERVSMVTDDAMIRRYGIPVEW
jgi:PIN domain nuclease of toxin-antitoxin system